MSGKTAYLAAGIFLHTIPFGMFSVFVTSALIIYEKFPSASKSMQMPKTVLKCF